MALERKDQTQPTTEEIQLSFRDSLGEVATILQKLSPHCQTVDDLLGVVQLALENDHQLRLLMSLVAGKK